MINLDKKELTQKTFIFSQIYQTKEQYFTIKIDKIVSMKENEVMISIVDNSE